MVVWMVWLAPPPPTPEPTSFSDSLGVVEPVTPQEPAPLAEATPALPPVDTLLAATTTGEERFITVDTDFYVARFSTKGGTLVSFTLKTYENSDHGAPVQLVDTTGFGALALFFTTPSNRNVDTRSLYFEPSVTGNTLHVTDAASDLTFRTGLGEGAIAFTYTFTPSSYEIGFQVAQTNASTFTTIDGYELLWDGGLPFSEGNAENEGMRSGSFVRTGGDVEGVTLDSDPYEERTFNGEISWASVKNKYFTAVMIPSGETRGAELIGEKGESPGRDPLWEDYEVRLMMPRASETPDVYRLYMGPMEFYRLRDYDLDLYNMVDYGWDFFETITRPLAKFVFIPSFTLLSQFIPNYGVVIIILALLIKIVLFPLTKSSFKSMARMRELQPKMEAIKEKYGDNPQKQQEAMMKMYRETGVNPIGGCLPMLLQYPIIIALWQFLPQSIEIRQQGFLWAEDLSAPDILFSLPFEIPFYGDFVAGFTFLMGLSMVVQMRIQSAATAPAQAKMLIYIFPVMIFVIFNKLASGLNLYYLCYNVLTAAQQQLINKSLKNEEDKPSTNGKGTKRDAVTAKNKARRSARDRKVSSAKGRKGKGSGSSKRGR